MQPSDLESESESANTIEIDSKTNKLNLCAFSISISLNGGNNNKISHISCEKCPIYLNGSNSIPLITIIHYNVFKALTTNSTGKNHTSLS